MLILSMTVAVALGWVCVRQVLPAGSLRPRWAGWLLEISLATGFGIGLTSSLFLLLLVAGVADRWTLIALELLLLAGAAWLVWRRSRPPLADVSGGSVPPFRWNRLLALVLLFGIVLVTVSFIDSARANPFGAWDAWSIWNLRAKFLAGGETWEYAYSPLLSRTHPDYPLLLSGFVARSWTYLGSETAASVPVATAFLFEFAAIGLLISSLAVLRSASLGLLAGLVILASSGFLAQGAWQYADVPLGFYVLAALVLLLAEAGAGPRRGSLLALAGGFAAFGAWTKNEGLLFFVVLFAVQFLVEWRGTGWKAASIKSLYFLSGAAPLLLVTLYFKFFVAPVVDPLATQSVVQALARIREPGRLVKITMAFFWQARMLGNGWAHPALALAILAAGLRFRIAPHQRRWSAVAGLTLAGVLTGYFCVYAVTPADLDWHLSTSLGRLYVHVWPSLLLLSFVLLRRPEETVVRAADKSTGTVGGRKKQGRKKKRG